MNATRLAMLLLGGASLAMMAQGFVGSQLQRTNDNTCQFVISAPWLSASETMNATRLIRKTDVSQQIRLAVERNPDSRFLISGVRTGTPGQSDDQIRTSQFFRLNDTAGKSALLKGEAFEDSGSIQAIGLLILAPEARDYQFNTRCAQIRGTLDTSGNDIRMAGTQRVNILTW